MCDHQKEESWWLKDAMGIECARVCARCVDRVKARYEPAIFDQSTYREVVEEDIDGDGDFW